MQFVLFDEDEMFRSIAEDALRRDGHEIVGIADSALSCVGLVESSKPDCLLVDLSSGSSTDFDVVQTANDVGTNVIIFSFLVDDVFLRRYEPEPMVVPKPDFAELEKAIMRVDLERSGEGEHAERRRNPGRAADGPEPTGISDAQAFFEALSNAVEGDTLASIDPPNGVDVSDVAARLRTMIRQSDRLLAAGSSIKVLLPAGKAESKGSFLDRLDHGVHVPHGTHVRTVILNEGETGSDAFERLKQSADDTEL
jgi:hypothetical protein